MSPDDAASLDAVVFDYGNVVYTWDPYGALPGRATMRQWEDFVAHGTSLAGTRCAMLACPASRSRLS